MIAFVRLDAANSTGQDILFNPGGPGGSGINYVLSGGGAEIISLTGGLYNVVSFDPRGVNNTGIALTCFPDKPKARDAYFASTTPSLSLNEQYYQAATAGQWCSEQNNDTSAKYAGTSAVVQDMIHFTELQAALDGAESPEEAEIWYYGVSYGTVIGHTLAALYPERVGRIIVDANVNSEEYYNGLTASAVEDTDDAVGWFFSLCHEAGLPNCAFAGNSSSADEVKQRFDDLLASLERAPVSVIDSEVVAIPTIITKTRVLSLLFNTLYDPIRQFPALAYGLAGLEKNNGSAWIDTEVALSRRSDPGPFDYNSAAAQEVLMLVTAIDAAGRYPIENVDEYLEVAEELEELSVYAGRGYAETNALINSGLKVVPPPSQLFSGKFALSSIPHTSTDTNNLAGFERTNTSNPILFINTAADPITPTSGAEHMSQYFEGSVVLVQNSVGHSSTSAPSKCTYGHVLAYLADATLPEAGTVCEADRKAFDKNSSVERRELPIVRRHLW